MTTPTDLGKNRTGAGTSPKGTPRTAEGAKEGVPAPDPMGLDFEAERLAWSKDAEPVGTMPPPPTLKGMAKTGLEALKGNDVKVFLDKLGERLAFERTGTRLYEALLVKFDASSPHAGGPTRAELEHIRDEELQHFGLLIKAFEQLGADPTAMTPCADIAAVASSGIAKVLADPRTTLTQCLDAILIAELADNDGWTMLVDLAKGLGKDELAEQFRTALANENEHLANVRRWLSVRLRGQVGVAPTKPIDAGARAPQH